MCETSLNSSFFHEFFFIMADELNPLVNTRDTLKHE